MKIYVSFYDNGYYTEYIRYIGAYSTKEKAEKSIERDIVRRHKYVPDDGIEYYNDLRSNYNIIEDEVE